LIFLFSADRGTAQILNKLNGNWEVEGAILRLEFLLKEENVMVGVENMQNIR
jgi:hypothetical protein